MKSIILGLVALVCVGVGYTAASLVSAAGTPGIDCLDWREDVNRDCVVNSIDLSLVAQKFGPVPPIPTATPTNTPADTATPTATETPTSTNTPVPTATDTVVPTATSTPTVAPTPTATATPSGADICTDNPDCGTPRNFCDTWSGGWCNDYRSVGAVDTEQPFDLVANQASFDCLDTGNTDSQPSMMGGALPFPCIFAKKEHFMTRMESGGFGIAILRNHRPVDLTSERHIHFEADLKPHNTRNYFRLMLSPDLTKRDPDDRGGGVYPRSFLEAWFRNGGVEGTICRNMVCDGDSYPWGDAFGSGWPDYTPLLDNVRVDIDVYVSQTSIRIYINGSERVNDTFAAPLNFNKAYLYLTQASYNPCKDGNCAAADNIAHWDNVAVDGPTLAPNSLTPAGWRDVVFNVYSATGCQVNGTAALPAGEVTGYTVVTWSARIPDDGAAVNIVCQYSYQNRPPTGVEIVRPY